MTKRQPSVVKPYNVLKHDKERSQLLLESPHLASGFSHIKNTLLHKKLVYRDDVGHFPLAASLEGFHTRYAIIGGNSVLGALLLLSAAKLNVPVVYCPFVVETPDCWSYDLLRHPGFRIFLERVAGYNEQPVYKPDWGLGFETKSDAAFEWVLKFFDFIGKKIQEYGTQNITRVDQRFSYKLPSRELGKERIVYLTADVKMQRSHSETQRKCDSALWGGILKNIPKIGFSTDTDLSHHLFVRQVVLTSHIDGFAHIDVDEAENGDMKFIYSQRFVATTGSATSIVADPVKAVENAVEDVLRTPKLIL